MIDFVKKYIYKFVNNEELQMCFNQSPLSLFKQLSVFGYQLSFVLYYNAFLPAYEYGCFHH